MEQKMLNNYLSTEFEQTGTLYELLNSDKGKENCQNFVVPIGEENSKAVYQDLSKTSHMLISGTTGSGKTTFIQSVLSSLMLTVPVDMAKFIIYDSKHIDYMFFKDAPQLLLPIINDSQKAEGAISWLGCEANNRLSLRTESIDKFNALPHIFMILDDYSEVAAYDENYECLVSLLKIGRSVNIHCILSTSTPTSKVVSTEIKANVPCRIAFHTTQKSVSRMILDENGAEMLQIPGEMIFKGLNQNVQCTGYFVTDDEVKTITQELSKKTNCTIASIGNMAASVFGADTSENTLDGDEDALLAEAIELAEELGMISASMIQRRLKIGYARAGMIIDQMEAKGIISGSDGSKPREVLISKEKIAECNSNKISQADVVNLRPFPKIESFGESIEIKDNLIYVKKITKRQGPYVHTAEYTFNSQRLTGLIYSKPKLFSKGFITFVLKPNSWNINDTRINNQYESNLPQTELTLCISKSNADLFRRIAEQVAEDCSIDVKCI